MRAGSGIPAFVIFSCFLSLGVVGELGCQIFPIIRHNAKYGNGCVACSWCNRFSRHHMPRTLARRLDHPFEARTKQHTIHIIETGLRPHILFSSLRTSKRNSRRNFPAQRDSAITEGFMSKSRNPMRRDGKRSTRREKSSRNDIKSRAPSRGGEERCSVLIRLQRDAGYLRQTAGS